MKLSKLFKYSFRFLFLQIVLTYTTIFYFNAFLIPTKFCELCSGNSFRMQINNNLWEENNVYQNEKEIYPQSLDGIIKIIDNVINENDTKTELIKYLFGKSLNKLNNA